MITEEVKIKIDIADAATSIKDVKSSIKDLQSSALAIGEGGAGYDQLIAKAGELRDKMGDVNDAIKAVSGNNFENLGAGLAGVAQTGVRGFQALIGAQELFGVKSEESLEALRKIQAIAGFADGIQGLSKYAETTKALSTALKVALITSETQVVVTEAQTVATGEAIVAQEGLNAAMKANPVGAIIIAIAALAAGLFALNSYLTSSTEETKKLEEENVKLTKAYEQQKLITESRVAILNSELDILKAQGAPLEEIRAKQEEINLEKEKELTANIAVIKSSIALNEQKIKDVESNNSLYESYLEAAAGVQRFLGNTVAAEQSEAALALNKKERAEEFTKTIEEQKVNLLKAETDYAVFKNQVTVQEINDNKAIASSAKETSDAVIQAAIDEENALFEIAARERERLAQQEADELKQFEDWKARKAEERRIAQEDEDNLFAIAANSRAQQAELDAQEDAEFEAWKQRRQEKADAELAMQTSIVSSTANALGSISNLFKQGSKASKIAALGEIAANTAVGFIQGLDIAQKGAKALGPAAPFAFPIFYASQIAAVLGAASKAKGILQSGSGGASAPSIPATPSIPNVTGGGSTPSIVPNTNLFATTGAGGGGTGGSGTGTPNAIQAYVLSSNVSSEQERNAMLARRATFGVSNVE